MARKTSRKSAARPASRGSKSDRERIIDAFMTLLAEKPIERIGFAEIAKSARVSLSELRGMFPSMLAILAAQMREIDRAVLAGGDAELADEPPRERLFDVLMRRLEVLAPHRGARPRARTRTALGGLAGRPVPDSRLRLPAAPAAAARQRRARCCRGLDRHPHCRAQSSERTIRQGDVAAVGASDVARDGKP